MKMFVLLLAVAVATAAAEYNASDPVAAQLQHFKEAHTCPVGVLTTTSGAPVSYTQATNTLNTKFINNPYFMELMDHLIRERTPERVVHAKGTGAFGYFEVTHDISHICKADFLSTVGKKTPIAMRFSTSAGSRGSSELEMDTRGFSVKFYTEKGNFDMAGFNTKVFSFKDPLRAHAIIHGPRRNPATNVPDLTMSWDRFAENPETLHMMIYVLSGRGLPASYRHMPGWGIHTFQVHNKHGELHFVRFYFEPDCGEKFFSAEEAKNIGATDPDYLTKDLYQAISNGDFPSWTAYAQILTKADVDKEGHYVFDPTKMIPEDRYPWQKFGKLVLNRNPKNHFAEIEQLAICPCNLVPGIDGGLDKLYEARRMIYRNAQLHRLGSNFYNIPVNCPFKTKIYTYHRDGMPSVGNNGGDAPNYYPNTFHGPEPDMEEPSVGLMDIMESEADNFDQAGDLYANGLTSKERTTLVENLVSKLIQVIPFVRRKVVKLFTMIHEDLGSRLAKAMNLTMSSSEGDILTKTSKCHASY